MAYFRNNTVNLLNLHYGLHSFALSGSSAFFGVFLLKSGVPAPIVLLSIAAILLGRLLIRPSVLIFAKRFGMKPLLIAGTIATSLQYPLLAEVDGIGVGLFVLCAVSSFGGAMALAAFAGAVGGLLLGRLIDAGHGTRAAIVALVVMAVTTTLRAVSVGNAPLAVLANASGALVACLYVPVLGTAIYNQAKRSPCTLRFHIASEAGWDLGGACALLAAAGLLQAGVPIGTCNLLVPL